jgi:archaemetzincin
MFLDLVPIELDHAQRGMLEPLGYALGELFGLEARVRVLRLDCARFRDARRGQYNSSLLIRHLAELASGVRILGVAGVDLYVPVFSFVLGEAMLEGPAALVSSFRMRNGRNGVAASDEQLFARLVKAGCHELGHTYGLLHCLDPACVMHSATSVEEVDLKSTEPCGHCLSALRARQRERRRDL